MKRIQLFYRVIATVLFIFFLYGINFSQVQNYALQFDGNDDYVDINPSPSLIFDTALTIEAWIYYQGRGSAPHYNDIFVNAGVFALGVYRNGNVEFIVITSNPGVVWVNSGYYLQLNTWTHLALTYSSSSNKCILYVNGNNVFSSEAYGMITDSDTTKNDLSIGNFKYPLDAGFYGSIDEVKIWNIALDSSTIKNWKNKTVDASHPHYSGLKGYWRFDEGVGGTTNDQSGNGNNGTLLNIPTWVISSAPINGLIAYYPFNGNANDESGNGNNGIVSGAVLTTDRFGNTNSAFSFDGVDDYIIGSANNFPTANRTISLWFNIPTVSNKPYILGYGGSSPPNDRSWLMNINTWGLGAYTITVHSQPPGGGISVLYPYPTPPVNAWHHFVGTTSDSGTRIYVDGQLKASQSFFINNTIVQGKDFIFGADVYLDGHGPWADNNGGYFNGHLDDIRVYNSALSPSEIDSLYHEGGWDAINPCSGTPTVSYSGKTYNTVQIGSQCWLKENLNVGTMIPGTANQTENSTLEKYCYNNDTTNCNIYGGLYQWHEAMQYSTSQGAQGICPTGWHIPTYAEFQTLRTSVNYDGNALKAIGQGTANGTGTNISGFSALFSGSRGHDGNFYYFGEHTFFWGSTEYDATYAYPLALYCNDSYIDYAYSNKVNGFSVRCLQDVQQQTYTLNDSVAGNGTITKNPDQATYTSGSTVVLTAVADTGYHFTGWSGDTSGTANPITIIMNSNKHIIATFSPDPGSISGIKFNDVNGNGVKDNGELGLINWLIRLNGSKTDSVLTDSLGIYSFTNLLPGNYLVRELQQTGWYQTTTNPDTLTITAGDSVTNINFGNAKYGVVSGIKFLDCNGNGIKDTNDAGIANWKIKLSGAKTDSVLTDANGYFTFYNLITGNYTLQEELQSGWVRSYPDSAYYSLTIQSGDTLVERNFGNAKYCSISGLKFLDINGNGEQAVSDTGLANWRIYLFKNDTLHLIDSVQTNTSGEYLFGSLIPGTYYVREKQESGWKQTTVNPSAITLTSSLTAGTNSMNKNFGNFKLGSISGKKFLDLNSNGVLDNGENGIYNWVLVLKRGGVEISRDTTASDGTYSFLNLSAGNYLVREVQKPGWTQTTPDPDSVTLLSGDNISSMNFGNVQLGSISGKLCLDIMGDSLVTSDPALFGWIVKLYKDCVLQSAVTTLANGLYSFGNLLPGTYTVEESLKANWIQSYPRVGGGTVTLSTCGVNAGPRAYTVIIYSGTVVTNQDFANLQYGKISGRVYQDLNADSVLTNDSLLNGWTVKLYRQGCSFVNRMATSSSGDYEFTNLYPGTYVVQESLATGWIQSFPRLGAGITSPCGTNAGPRAYITTIQSGTNSTGINFGNYQLGSIGGIVFNDLNGNGVNDAGENGLSNWAIYIDRNNNGSFDSGEPSAITGAGGVYQFTGLTPGQYIIREISQAGWLETTQNPITVQLLSGQNPQDINLGNFQFGSICGFAFNDLNSDGTKQPTEPYLVDWKIYSRKLTEVPPTDSISTIGSGTYCFDSLLFDTYVISIEQRDGWNSTTFSSDTISIISGTSVNNLNFGAVFGLNCELLEKWNLLSLPVEATNNRKDEIFPTAISNAFRYDGGYISSERLYNGIGYWLKFPSITNVSIFGAIVSSDTIDVKKGWNLIGSISNEIAVTCIQPLDTNITHTQIESSFFGYNNGYTSASIIEPCKAYWVKVSADGQLVLNGDCVKKLSK